MQSVFNAAFLARLRRQTEETSITPDRVESFEVKVATDCDTLNRGRGAHRNYDQNTDDPDDLTATVMRRSDDLLSLPEMPPCSWWIQMVLGTPDDAVSPGDVGLCLQLVAAHLQTHQSADSTDEEAHPPSPEAVTARLRLEEGKDSGLPATIGALHEAIESIGPNAWSVFVNLWQKACGIQEPAKNEKRKWKPTGASIHPAEPHGKPDTPLPPLPPTPYEIEEGLYRALSGMPERVAAFMLHTPKDPPPWRYRESEGERSAREGLESIGGWTGL
jgi:hypothetical protein